MASRCSTQHQPYQVFPVLHVQLSVDRLRVFLEGRQGNVEHCCNLRSCHASRDQVAHFTLTVGERQGFEALKQPDFDRRLPLKQDSKGLLLRALLL